MRGLLAYDGGAGFGQLCAQRSNVASQLCDLGLRLEALRRGRSRLLVDRRLRFLVQTRGQPGYEILDCIGQRPGARERRVSMVLGIRTNLAAPG
ncbi:MAG: hypothetical protein OSB38_38270 [Paraburkholderia fungorum]|nr:hypothetical protein [Paraburkholderia fungorum]